MLIELPRVPSRTLNRLLKSGAFSSPAEVVAEGLRLLQALDAGVRQVRERKLSPFDDAAVARIKARGRRVLASEGSAKRSANR